MHRLCTVWLGPGVHGARGSVLHAPCAWCKGCTVRYYALPALCNHRHKLFSVGFRYKLRGQKGNGLEC